MSFSVKMWLGKRQIRLSTPPKVLSENLGVKTAKLCAPAELLHLVCHLSHISSQTEYLDYLLKFAAQSVKDKRQTTCDNNY